MKLLFVLLAAGIAAMAQVRTVVSSAAGDRLAEKPAVAFGPAQAGLPSITVDAARRFQTIEGFGATFNESGLMVLNKLASEEQERVLRSVFDLKQGAGFTLMKAPLAACDFSAAGPWYTYDDVPGDVELRRFTLERDLGPNGQVTFIKRARRYGSFKIQGTTDYPPDWMLDNQNLKPEYYPVFANYLVKYAQEYMKQGIDIDFLSPFNEPQYIYCKIRYEEIRELIKNHIGPAFRRSGLKTQLQVSDSHNRETGLKEFPKVLDDPEARQYIATMPVHGYGWEKQGSGAMGKLHDLYPGIPVWQTEVCYAKVIDKKPMPVFGFEDGDRWGRMLVADLKNWAAGWIYWNLFLDAKGGPWLVSIEHRDPEDNPQHPVVIIDTEKKQPVYTGLYYYLAHFSKYVRPGAVRIDASGDVPGLEFVAFEDKGGGRVLEAVNSAAEARRFVLRDGPRTAVLEIPARGIATFLW
jgi:glucosylceramidase